MWAGGFAGKGDCWAGLAVGGDRGLGCVGLPAALGQVEGDEAQGHGQDYHGQHRDESPGADAEPVVEHFLDPGQQRWVCRVGVVAGDRVENGPHRDYLKSTRICRCGGKSPFLEGNYPLTSRTFLVTNRRDYLLLHSR